MNQICKEKEKKEQRKEKEKMKGKTNAMLLCLKDSKGHADAS